MPGIDLRKTEHIYLERMGLLKDEKQRRLGAHRRAMLNRQKRLATGVPPPYASRALNTKDALCFSLFFQGVT